MKKKIYVLITMLALTVTAMAAPESKDKGKNVQLTEMQVARVQQIKSRVEEIKSMDKSNLSKQERKQLRHELKGMNKEMRAMTGGGVYLSVGAIIIIILVLLLIL